MVRCSFLLTRKRNHAFVRKRIRNQLWLLLLSVGFYTHIYPRRDVSRLRQDGACYTGVPHANLKENSWARHTEKMSVILNLFHIQLLEKQMQVAVWMYWEKIFQKGDLKKGNSLVFLIDRLWPLWPIQVSHSWLRWLVYSQDKQHISCMSILRSCCNEM